MAIISYFFLKDHVMNTLFSHQLKIFILLSLLFLWRLEPGLAQDQQINILRKQISQLQRKLEAQEKLIQQLKTARLIDSTHTAIMHQDAMLTFDSMKRMWEMNEMSKQKITELTEKASQQSERIADTWSAFGENMGWVIDILTAVILVMAALAGYLGFRQVKDLNVFKKKYEEQVENMREQFEHLKNDYQKEADGIKIELEDFKSHYEKETDKKTKEMEDFKLKYDKDLEVTIERFRANIEKEQKSRMELTGLLHLGDQYLSTHEYLRAIQLYDSMMSNWDDLPIIHFQKGMAFAQLSELDDAINAFSHAIELNPNFFNAYWQLGLAQRRVAEKQERIEDLNLHFENAVKTIQKAIELQKHDGDIVCVLGGIYKRWGQTFHRLGDMDAALRYWRLAADTYQKAMQIEPEVESYARVNLGTLKILIGKKEKAEEDFRILLEQCEKKEIEKKDDLWTWFDKGLAHWALGEFELAKAAHQKGLSRVLKRTDKISVIEQLELLKEITGDKNGELENLITIMSE